MGTQGDEYKITRLSAEKSNYNSWAIRVKAALISKGLWEAIDPGYGPVMSDADRKGNDKALSFLFLLVEDNYLDDIGNHQRAKEAWQTLSDMHTKFGLLHILQLLRDLFNINKKPDEGIQSYLARIMDVHRKLESCGYGFTDKEVSLIMLLGLPKSYENLILNLEHDITNLTSQLVKARLAVEEKRQIRRAEDENQIIDEELNGEKALITRKNVNYKNPRRAKKPSNNKPSHFRNVICFCCGAAGHIANDCPERERKNNKGNKQEVANRDEGAPRNAVKKVSCLGTDTEEKELSVYSAALYLNEKRRNESNINVAVWYLDSGATNHMSSRKDKMTNFNNAFKSTVEVANRDLIAVEGMGDMTIHTAINNTPLIVQLHNVLYVPELDGNLLSIGRIEEKGYSATFEKGTAIIKRQDGQAILKATRIGRLYAVEETHTSDAINIAKSVYSPDQDIWHRRMGHVHDEALRVLLKGNYTSSEQPCEICILGKLKRKPFPTNRASRSTRPLELIHSDVVGKIEPTSKGGKRYVITFVDDYSRRIATYFMKYKSEAFAKFKQFKEAAEVQFGLKISTLRTDNGGEYISHEFNDYLKENGIKHQLTIPATPQQNGVAERVNQTLLDMTRCLLLESGIPRCFWADALNTAVYLRNRCPSKAINNQLPEELWTGKPTSLDNIRVFGCRVWAVKGKLVKRTKLDPKAEETVFIGYPEDVKGYKLWNYANDTVFISRDVVFDEQHYPLKIDNQLNSTTIVTEDEDVVFVNEDSLTESDEEDETSVKETNDNIDKNLPVQSKHSTSVVDLTVHPLPTSTERLKRQLPLRRSERLAQKKANCKKAQEMQNMTPDPTTVREALLSEDATHWIEAMTDEINMLRNSGTWKLVPEPLERKTIGSKWLFRKKYKPDGTLERYKARLVAKGFSQISGMDYTNTYSPVMKMKSLRLLVAFAVKKNWVIRHIDISGAYLNGTLKEDIYMQQPEFFVQEGKENWVCHLQKTLYGLKQSGREWNKHFDSFLTAATLTRSKTDPCIYFNLADGLILGIYVDDIFLIAKDDKTATQFVKTLEEAFDIHDLGLAENMLSICITQNEDGSVALDQKTYIETMLHTFEMSECKGIKTPLDCGIKLVKPSDEQWMEEDEDNRKIPYRQAVGSILYLASTTRPDLAFPATYLSQFNERYTKEHWTSVKHVLRYINKTKDHKLVFNHSQEGLTAYSDADWARDKTDRKSYSGYVFMLGGTAISWCSRKQKTIALSTVEAEYLAMCEASKEILWLTSLLTELDEKHLIGMPPTICVDNQGAMCLAQNQISSDRSKHIDIRHFFLREMVNEGTVVFKYVATENNLADMFTKPLGASRIKQHCEHMGLHQNNTTSTRGSVRQTD